MNIEDIGLDETEGGGGGWRVFFFSLGNIDDVFGEQRTRRMEETVDLKRDSSRVTRKFH